MLLSMLLAALLGQPALEPVAAAASSPARPSIEISLPDTLRALPASSASAHGSFVPDDGNAGGDQPALFEAAATIAAFPAEAAFALDAGTTPAGRRAGAHRARAPPAA